MVLSACGSRQLPPLLATAARLWHERVMQQSLRPLSDAYALASSGQLSDAIRLFEVHAERGNGEALFTLGDVYWRGIGAPQDLARGRDLFRRSSEADFDIGKKAYTNLLASGHAGPRDWKEAVKRLEGEAAWDPRRAQILNLLRAMPVDGDGNPVDPVKPEPLSTRPDVRIARNAFTALECRFLMLLAEPSYERAGVVISPGQNIPAFMRTADGSTIHWLIEDPAVHAMNRRIAVHAGVPVTNGEPMQILRYREGQEYRPHFDWLEVGNRRVMTALIYLNDDYEGGETEFTEVGLKVKGRAGDLLLFHSRGPDGGLDPLSKHAGLPVSRGTKYLGSRWIREASFTL